MSELDLALEASLQDEGELEHYYELILNSDFYIPLQEDEQNLSAEPESVRPLILESEGKDYLLLFDSKERLAAWAQKDVPYVILAGFGAAAISTPELHWAVNLGSSYAKQLLPDEIRWLREQSDK